MLLKFDVQIPDFLPFSAGRSELIFLLPVEAPFSPTTGEFTKRVREISLPAVYVQRDR